MKTTMTERDKKLLVFLAFFLIIVGFGYWGIRPLIKNIVSYNESIEEETAKKDMNELKIMQLPVLEVDNADLEKDILDARAGFYPMMSSDEIDKMFTGMALGYNLNAYELNISMPKEEATLVPYVFSQKALMPEEDEEPVIISDEEVSEPAPEAVVAFEDEETYQTGIYAATVSMRVGGDKALLQKLIDDLSASDKKHLLKSYTWGTSNSSSVVYVNGEYELDVTSNTYVDITLDIYMCEE